jgi:pimeloyl-ACP methyl ester carboxylesterase
MPNAAHRRSRYDRRQADFGAIDLAVIAHDASSALREIGVPTLITFGARDLVCSTRFAEPLKSGIGGSELVVFEHLSHAGLHEDPETFNRATLDFLLRQRS